MELFAISSILIFFSSLGFGLALSLSNKGSALIKSWFFNTITIGLWGLGLYGVVSSSDAGKALYWQYLLDVSAIFIPYANFLFFQKLVGKNFSLVNKLTLLLAVVLAIFSFTPLFKVGMTMKFGVLWINPGTAYAIFPVYFLSFIVIATSLLVSSYLTTDDKLKKRQIRNVILAGLFGFGGGITNFFPQLFEVYPFGNYFVILYIFFISYGVLHYKLMNAKVLAAQIFAGAIGLVSLFSFLQSNSLTEWLVGFLTFALMVFFGIFLVRSVYREVAQREQIQKLAEDLERANEEQGNLIYFITHQVKGFLTKTRNIFSLMLEGDYGPVPPEMLPAIKEGFVSDSRGASMVQQVLDASNIKKGTMTYTMVPFDFRALVEKVYNEMEGAGKDKGLDMRLDISGEGFTVNGDELQLKQVVKNLLDNAIRYTVKGSVHVFLKKEGERVVYSVADTGVGMSDDDKTRLFTAGGRGKDSRKTNVDSTGFGLFIVKRIVEAHKGTVSADSVGPGKGSVFKVII